MPVATVVGVIKSGSALAIQSLGWYKNKNKRNVNKRRPGIVTEPVVKPNHALAEQQMQTALKSAPQLLDSTTLGTQKEKKRCIRVSQK